MARSDRTENRKMRNRQEVMRVPEMGYYLVVTDTEATERCYFEGLQDSLPGEVKQKLVIKVVETKTQNLIQKCSEMIAYQPIQRLIADRSIRTNGRSGFFIMRYFAIMRTSVPVPSRVRCWMRLRYPATGHSRRRMGSSPATQRRMFPDSSNGWQNRRFALQQDTSRYLPFGVSRISHGSRPSDGICCCITGRCASRRNTARLLVLRMLR